MIFNKTNQLPIVNKTKHAKSIISKAIGLMFSRKLKDTGLIFHFDKPKIIGLHMMFVFYPIDVLYLNEKMEVIETKENFKPFSIYTPKNKAICVIELPTKTIEKSKIKIKDKIIFS